MVYLQIKIRPQNIEYPNLKFEIKAKKKYVKVQKIRMFESDFHLIGIIAVTVFQNENAG